jgi:cell division protein FtsQ
MDGRGRELQQVEGRQRFWWRAAHDAPTPEPDAARWVVPTDEVLTHGRTATATLSQRLSPRLRIPLGERRLRRQKRGKRWVLPTLAVATCGALTGLAAYAIPVAKLKAIEISANANDLVAAAGFGIDQVNVSGQHYTADTDIFDALDLPNVKTFAAFDSDAALKRIGRIPWVDTVQLTRIYPGTLDIVIHERTPSFVWTRGDKNYLVDATGRTLGPMAAGSNWNLPRVVGEGADTEAILMLSALRQYPRIEKQYAYAERIAERRWRIVLKNGTALDLAADREVEGFDEIANTSAAASSLTGNPVIVDVRTPGRIAMRPVASSANRTSSLRGVATTSLASTEQ